MSTRCAGIFLAVAAAAARAVAAPAEPVDVNDRRFDVGGVLVDVGDVLAPSAPASEPRAAEAAVARLVWIDPSRAALPLGPIARDETRSVIKRIGASVEWRIGDAGEQARPGEVRVILVDRAAARVTGEPILGATPPRFEGQPYLWVHLPNVRATMGLRPAGPLVTVDPSSVRALGVALGRVIAHELVHVLVPSTPHGKGLMSERLSRQQLTTSRLDVDAATSAALLASIRGEPAPARADADVLAATAAARNQER